MFMKKFIYKSMKMIKLGWDAAVVYSQHTTNVFEIAGSIPELKLFWIKSRRENQGFFSLGQKYQKKSGWKNLKLLINQGKTMEKFVHWTFYCMYFCFQFFRQNKKQSKYILLILQILTSKKSGNKLRIIREISENFHLWHLTETLNQSYPER